MYVMTTRRTLDPFQNLRRLNSLLDEAFGSWPIQRDENGTLTAPWSPACDVFEDKDSVKIVAEIPGVKPEDVKISIENHVLTVRGEKKQVAEETAERVHRYERSYGAFERNSRCRSWWMLTGSRRSNGGILTVTLPKAERARPREISVTVA